MSYISGFIGNIPVVTTNYTITDIIGAIKVRWSINRNNYAVKPGLYAIGNPNKSSEIYVSANYKLSFDHLRKNLNGTSSWILVLDTKGINVWCAAGKGTFGTEELISKINEFKISEIVVHKRIIVPQLGAVGVSAHEVKSKTNFNVKYGPIKATDIKEFVENNYKTSPKMRLVTFTFYERLKLAPVELVGHLKYFIFFVALTFIISCFKNFIFDINSGFNYYYIPLINFSSAYLAGTVLFPVLLPFIPVKYFSFKGLLLSIVISLILLKFGLAGKSILEIISYFFINSAVVSFTAMNFTGATVYTSLSGVKKEMKIWLPTQIILFSLGIIQWLIFIFFE